MPNIIGLTKAEMQAMTAVQLRQAGKAYLDTLTKHDLIVFYLDKSTDDDDPIVEYLGANGQISKLVIFTRDIETNAKQRSKVTLWTYYDTGEVNVITLKDLDAADVETQVIKVKHYLDGRQPKVIA